MFHHHTTATPVPSARFRLRSSDGLRIECYRWDARDSEQGHEVRGVVQLAHGMGEHVGRYGGVVDALVLAGFTVYGNDHRGHGRTVRTPGQRGDFGKGGFDLLVEDMRRLSRVARDAYPDEPLFLLGHGMGSFAAQQYVLDDSALVHGLILSGTGSLDSLSEVVRSAPEGTNVLNRAFEPARTPFDWLTRDDAAVDAFIADPLCFPQLRPESLESFLAVAPRLCDPGQLARVRSDLPVFIFAGGEDPVGQRLEGVRTLMDRYRRAGVDNITHDFYPGARHEMLNETCRAEVHARLLRWLDGALRGHHAVSEPDGRPAVTNE